MWKKIKALITYLKKFKIMPDNNYPWYEVVNKDENFQQGDFVFDCPIIIPPEKFINTKNHHETLASTYDVIIMSQSCDLQFEKLEIVLVCPFWYLSDFAEKDDFYKGKKGKNALKQGLKPNLHLLNKCNIEGYKLDFMVVNFREVFGVHYEFLKNFRSKQRDRLRLLPPYREHLSQAFARFFMRVGLPTDIPEFK
jgi:hypothetical protein